VKCELASAVVGQPRLLILDEPTIGVDVSSKVQIRRMINERVLSTGTAVLLTSHDMGDIEGVATRTVLLRDQGVHFSGNLAELRSRLRMRSVIRLQRSERPFDEQAIERIRGAVGSIGLDVNASDRAQLTIEVGESEVVQVLQRIPLDLADSVTIDLPTLEQALASEFAKW
jgi:ABC-2 type transport system ATP-binding protein